MKPIVAFAVVIAFAGGTVADIQDPPSNDYGPTRKLGRGLSNFFIAPAEVFVTVTTINTYDGNSAAAGYGDQAHQSPMAYSLTLPAGDWLPRLSGQSPCQAGNDR